MDSRLFNGPRTRWTHAEIEVWLQTRSEESFHPHVPIIDPHHHLFPALNVRLPVEVPPRIFATFGRAPTASRYLQEEMKKDFQNMKVAATVHVEAKTNYDKSLKYPSVGETLSLRHIHEQVPATGICRGIVAGVDLTLGAEEAINQVNAHRKALEGAACRLSGVRAQIANHPELVSPGKPGSELRYVAGARAVGELGLPVDVWLYHHQLPELVRLVKACPKTWFVCDHIATPTGTSAAVFETWLDGMRDLAQQSNVSVKLGECIVVHQRIGEHRTDITPVGGLGMHACGNSREQPLSSDELVVLSLKWFREVFHLFGEDRVMFESNFPMDKASFSYVAYWNAAKKMAIMLSPNPCTRRKLLFENANRLYSLGLVPPDESEYEFHTLAKI